MKQQNNQKDKAVIGFELPLELYNQIARYADQSCMSRSCVLRRLIKKALTDKRMLKKIFGT